MEAQLAEFKAGKLTRSGATLAPDPRKGVVRLCQTEDTLVHVQWYERTAEGRAAEPLDDVIVFPGEAMLEKIPGQRAVVLKFPEDKTRNMFFWLQEVGGTPEQDEALVAAFNTALHQPEEAAAAALAAAAASAAAAATSAGVTPSDALEHAHMSTAPGAGVMQGAGGIIGQLPAAPAQTPGSTAATNAQATNLAAILGNALAASLGGGAAPAYTGGGEEQLAHSLLAQLAAAQGHRRRAMMAPGPSLADVLRPEALMPVLRDPSVLQELAPHLPEEHRTTEALAALAHSPQFQQQLSTFSQALQTGQLDLSQFGLRAAGYSVADFLAAIQDLVERERQEQAAAEGGDNGGSGGQQGQGQGGQPGAGEGAAPMEQ
ncbi:hypothetical protein HYH02_008119 [Chlamydomonas schloesseri]|uniref:Regulatory particle non-ATPase 13 n=1 Tax=Chlamydomonas schloesseri TaxID=2026947 RepID=A0A835WGE0_9CHLO|nr:hypothetical protein HYH02_008119 [Chlamydomonas schloesseri]|eukprot:KAG2446965.1 hypothetical protein HYH02_008119 [Chlamydomonas schloesseri]